ncbi:MAG: hypothetical protein LBG61_06230 [Burkholderiales bacterium]|jgi:hypothetical protein|nr:hypothetical protein [Burkholderiales bacterium]
MGTKTLAVLATKGGIGKSDFCCKMTLPVTPRFLMGVALMLMIRCIATFDTGREYGVSK